MTPSMIHPDERRRLLYEKLYGCLRKTDRMAALPNGVAERPLDATMLDRLLAFRYVPRCEDWKAALERLEKGTYGVCPICHGPVSGEELAADPLTRFCASCERRFSKTTTEEREHTVLKDYER